VRHPSALSALWGNYDVFDARFYDPSKAVTIDPKTGLIVSGSGNIYNGVVIPAPAPLSRYRPFSKFHGSDPAEPVSRPAEHLYGYQVQQLRA
jgi:hypothetical protein